MRESYQESENVHSNLSDAGMEEVVILAMKNMLQVMSVQKNKICWSTGWQEKFKC